MWLKARAETKQPRMSRQKFKMFESTSTMDFVIDLLYYKIKSESKYDKNMDVKITACKSRIKNCTLAKKKIVG